MINRTMIQFFEWYCPADGRHWKRFAHAVPELLKLGITAAWLPPAYKGTKGNRSEGYDVYDIYDLGEFDQKGSIPTKYGTKEEYIEAVNYARSKGLEVYIDIVLNHMGGAEETEKFRARTVDSQNRLKFTSDVMEIEAYTKFRFPGRNGKYSDFVWDHNCFTGIDHALNKKEPAIYNIINDYGDDWEPMCDSEKGNFDYLMLNDIETRNPAVRNELKKWIRWYYDTVQFDGLRLDAVKHINPSFFNEWLDYVHEEISSEIFVLGEYWLSDDLPVLLRYLRMVNYRMSLFDAPLHRNFSIASEQREQYDLRMIFTDTLISKHPDLAVTFVDNHDTQPLQSLEEYTQHWFRPHAYALILLRNEGYPCVFYPDIYGSCYNDNEGDRGEIKLPVLDCLPLLLRVRKEIAYGGQHDYFDHPNCIGWTRSGIVGREKTGCAILISNDPSNMHSKQMHVGINHAGKKFVNLLNENSYPVNINDNGEAVFTVDPGTIAVYAPHSER